MENNEKLCKNEKIHGIRKTSKQKKQKQKKSFVTKSKNMFKIWMLLNPPQIFAHIFGQGFDQGLGGGEKQ